MASRAPDSSSSRSTRTARRWLLAVATAAVPVAAVGCDSPQGRADKSVDEKVAAALPLLSGSPANQVDAANQLGKAAEEADGGSKVEQVQVNVLKADAELRLAQDLAAKVAFYNRQSERLALDLSAMAAAVEAANGRVASLQKLKPDAAQAAVRKQAAAVTGSESSPDWVKSKLGTIASLAADDKAAADLSAEVDRLQASVKSETDDRDKLLAQGDQLADQSGRERGDKSVDLYTQAANARKQAADLNVKIDGDNVALGRAQADLDGVRQQQAAKQAAVKGFDAMRASVDTDWKDVQGRMGGAKAAAVTLLGDPVAVAAADVPKPLTIDSTADDLDARKPVEDKRQADKVGGPTIRYRAAMLVAVDKQARDLRGQAENHFNAALGFYRKAQSAADALRSDLDARMAVPGFSEKMDYPAVKGLADLAPPSRYRYLLAMAQLGKAEFFARTSTNAQAQIEAATRLKAALDVDSLEVPPGLDESAVTELTNRQKLAMLTARDGFRDATDQLGKLGDSGTTPRELRDAVRSAEVVAQYGWAQLEMSPGGNAADGATHLDLAKQKTAGVADLAYVPLPPELMPAAAGATPKPAGTR